MDSSEDEEDAENDIDDLLKALDGIEQCFVTDFEVAESKPIHLEQKTLFENVKKRSADPPLPSLPVPPPKKVCLRDPRLKKMCTHPAPHSTAPSTLPKFANQVDLPRVDESNAVITGLEKASTPIPIFSDLSNHLKVVSSPDRKGKREIPDKTNEIAGLAVDEIDYDSVMKGLTMLETVSKLKESSQSQVPFQGEFGETLKARTEPGLSMLVKKSNEQISNDSLCIKTTMMETSGRLSSIMRDPRTRTSTVPQNLEKMFTDDSAKSTLLSTLDENMPTSTLRSTRNAFITNHPPVASNAKSSLANELTNEDRNRIKLQEPSKRLETKTSQVNEANEERIISVSKSCLSPQILTKIFTYLPFSDTKNAKLVCKLWYDTFNVELFLKHQKFSCCGIYKTTSIMQTLSNSQCKHLNLEFNRVHFGNGLTELWKKIGPRIHTLYFVDCLVGPEAMWEVIVNCTEMKHLSLSFEYPKLPSLTEISLVLFKDLMKQQITRRKLISLDIHVNNANGWWLTNAILSNLFIVYPNISRLGFSHHALDPIADVCDLWSDTTLTFSPIFKYISARSGAIEKLELDVHMKGPRTAFAWQMIISHTKLTRLREIVIEIDLQKSSGVALIEFCVAQSELESINCKIVGSTNVFMSFFLLRLLNSCPRLRNLKVTNKDFLVSYEFFKELVFSKLESLSIVSSNILLARQITNESEWPVNEHLKSLTLSQVLGNNFKNLLITVFRKLKFLEVHDLSNMLLQFIWKFQTDLVTLKLNRVERCPRNGFCASPFTIRNLQNLEYLVLEAVDDEWSICGRMFSELDLPKLKYLYININVSRKSQFGLLNAIQKLTKLEGVSISCSGIERSAWLQLNKNWKKLRYLRIIDEQSQRFKMKQYFSYFETSPNLRAFIHEFMDSKETFYYDTLDKRVKRKDSSMKYRMNSEKVYNYSIDWLWY